MDINIKELSKMANKLTQPFGLDWQGGKGDDSLGIESVETSSKGSSQECQFLGQKSPSPKPPPSESSGSSTAMSAQVIDNKENESPSPTPSDARIADTLKKSKKALAHKTGLTDSSSEDEEEEPIPDSTLPLVPLTIITTNNDTTNNNKPQKKEPVRQRWPDFKNLATITGGGEAVREILRAMDDLDVASELKASSSENCKGNKWSKLHNHLFVGNMTKGGQAILAKCSFLPPLSSASTTTSKMLALCAWLRDNDNAATHARSFAGSLLDECQETKEKEETAREQLKSKVEAREKAMTTCERGCGFIPPGAKGNEKSSSRAEHSTNTRLGQPADYGYARKLHMSPTPKTPKTPRTSGVGADSSISGSTTVNNKALEDIKKIDTSLGAVCQTLLPGFNGGSTTTISTTITGKAKKKRKLEEKKQNLKEDIALMKEVGGDFTSQMAQCVGVSKAIMDLIDSPSDEEQLCCWHGCHIFSERLTIN